MAAPAILMSRRLRRRRSSRRRSGRCDLPPFSWTRLACHVPLGLLGREIAQSRVDPLPIVVSLHVSEEIAPRLVARGPAALMNELDLEGVEEALHRGIVIADRMFVAEAEAARPALCGERGLRRMGRHRASRTGDEPCSRIAQSLSVSIRPR